MAQTANVNIKIDSTQAEGSINKFNNSLKETNAQAGTLKSQLRAMQNELNGLEPGTQRFNELALAAGKLKDQIQDTQAVIKATAGSPVENLAKGLSTAGQVGIAAFQGMASAQALFGVESEALTQTLVKLQALAGLSQALETLGGLGDKFVEIKSSLLGFVKGLGLMTAAKEADIVVTGAEIVATEGATFATKAWGVAMKALPIVAIIAGIAALVYAISSYNDGNEEAEKAEKKRAENLKVQDKIIKEYSSNLAKEVVGIKILSKEILNSEPASKRRGELIKEMNAKYGTHLKNIKDEGDFTKQLNVQVREYIKLAETRIRATLAEETASKMIARENELRTKAFKLRKEAGDYEKYLFIDEDKRFSIKEKYVNADTIEGLAKMARLANEALALETQADLAAKYGDAYLESAAKYADAAKVGEKTETTVINKTKEHITINEDLKKSLDDLLKNDLDRTASSEYLLRVQKEAKDVELKIQYELSTDKLNRDKQLKDALLLNEKEYQSKLLKYKEGTDVIESETKINNIRLKIAKATGIELIGLQIQLQDEQLKLLEAQYQVELLAAGNNYKEQEKITSQYLLDKQKMEKDFSDKSVETTEETADKTVEVWSSKFSVFMEENAEMINFATSSISEAMGLLDQVFQLSADRATASREMFYSQETERLNKQLASQLISREEYDNQVAMLNQEKDQKELAAKRKAFKQQKAMNIISAIMNTAMAVGMALSSLPPPASYIMAAVSGALGAVQIGIIASQQFKAAKGGVVPGSQSGMDSVNALLSPGETVINSQSSSMFPELLSMVNQAGGGHSLTPQTPGKMKTSGVNVFQDNTSQPSVRAYVVESEITDKQRRVNRIERAVQF
jgi:hypothetical protein